jgi:hypothetical protein
MVRVIKENEQNTRRHTVFEPVMIQAVDLD